MKLKYRADLRKSGIMIYAFNNEFNYSFLYDGIAVKTENIKPALDATEKELIHVKWFIEELIEDEHADKLKYNIDYSEWRYSSWLPYGTSYYFYDDIKLSIRCDKEIVAIAEKKEAAEDGN